MPTTIFAKQHVYNLSDHELNKAIVKKLGYIDDCHIDDLRETISRHCKDGQVLNEICVIDYCKNNNDIMPIVWKYHINSNWRCNIWSSSTSLDDNAFSSHTNPLRAVAECYLLISNKLNKAKEFECSTLEVKENY